MNRQPSLLPPNASALQRHLALLESTRLATLPDAIDQLKTFKYAYADRSELLKWLIWEFGLEELLAYIPDLNRLLADGLRWQRLRGTPAGLQLALKWLGRDLQTSMTGMDQPSDSLNNTFNTWLEESPPGVHFADYQLSVSDIPSLAQLEKIASVATITAPVRSRLTRVFHRDSHVDRRPLALSASPLGSLLSQYSGKRIQGLVIAFGRKHRYHVNSGWNVKMTAKIQPNETRMQIALDWQIQQQRILSRSRSIDGHTTLPNWHGGWDQHDWHSARRYQIKGTLRHYSTARAIDPDRLYHYGVTLNWNCGQSVYKRSLHHSEKMVVDPIVQQQRAGSRTHYIGGSMTLSHWQGDWDQHYWNETRGYWLDVTSQHAT
jgi:P2-related tail formation protein